MNDSSRSNPVNKADPAYWRSLVDEVALKPGRSWQRTEEARREIVAGVVVFSLTLVYAKSRPRGNKDTEVRIERARDALMGMGCSAAFIEEWRMLLSFTNVGTSEAGLWKYLNFPASEAA
jgi:hypothetical protein